MLDSRVNFEFAFNDTDFSDRVLRIEIMADSLASKSDSEGCHNRKRKREKLDNEEDLESCTVAQGSGFKSFWKRMRRHWILGGPRFQNWGPTEPECPIEPCESKTRPKEKVNSTIVEVKTYHISSPILAGNSPFFHKLFKNGMRESKQRDATLIIYESEEAAVTDVLNFMYSNTLKATTTPDLLSVLIAADKFEVTSCMRYCSEMLQNKPMSQELALLFLKLPPSVLAAEVVQPLIDAAKKYLVAQDKDINMSKEMMDWPLSAVEVVLGSSGLKVDEEDGVVDFVLEWAREHYPKLEERREILTKRLAKCICFSQMSCSKLKEVLNCPDFDHEEATKLVLEALFLKINASNCTSLGRHYNLRPIKVVQFDFPQPCCVVYFDLKKEECENICVKGFRSKSFCLGGRWFHLFVQRPIKEPDSFGLFLCMEKHSESCTLELEFAVIDKSSKEFQAKARNNKTNFSDLRPVLGIRNLFLIPWIDFMSNDSQYFIDGILHLRAHLTITNTVA